LIVAGKPIKREIYVKGRLVNLVVWRRLLVWSHGRRQAPRL